MKQKLLIFLITKNPVDTDEAFNSDSRFVFYFQTGMSKYYLVIMYMCTYVCIYLCVRFNNLYMCTNIYMYMHTCCQDPKNAVKYSKTLSEKEVPIR